MTPRQLIDSVAGSGIRKVRFNCWGPKDGEPALCLYVQLESLGRVSYILWLNFKVYLTHVTVLLAINSVKKNPSTQSGVPSGETTPEVDVLRGRGKRCARELTLRK